MRLRTLLAAAGATAATLVCAAPAHAIETGIVETLGQNVSTPRKASRLGADWVRMWVSWASMQPAPGQYAPHNVAGLRGAVAAAKGKGLKVLIVATGSPGWASRGRGGIAPPSDPASFGAFMGGMAQRLPAVDAWELWNEPDSPGFFAGAPDPATYAGMLRAAYPAIKAAQPRAAVVTGGLVGNDMDFVEQLYRHGAQGSFDAVGVHTDTACLTNGPGRFYRDERGRIGRFTFTGYREVHAVMSAHGDGAKPIWMTEIGWNTQSTRRRSCNVGTWAGKKRLGVGPVRGRRVLVRDAGHPALAARAGLRAVPPRRPGQAVRTRVQEAAPRHQAAPLRRRRRPHAADDQGPQPGAGAALLRQVDGARARVRQQGRRRAAADLPGPRRPARAQLGRVGGLDRSLVGVGGLEARAAQAHVQRARQRAQRDVRNGDGPEGPARLSPRADARA
jgi:Cellulase (glycosyl hydrolase family 5)